MNVPFFTRFKNVTFDIMSTEDVGIFDVRSKFLGVEMEKVQLNIQVSWGFCKAGQSFVMWIICASPGLHSSCQSTGVTEDRCKPYLPILAF